MSSKIKVALCLSGEARSSMFCFPYIYEAFLKENQSFETDVYIHSWKGFRAMYLYKPKDYLIESNYQSKFLFDVCNKMGVKNWDEYTLIKNSISMAYGIQKCFSIIKDPYDIYIRLRPDIIFPNKYNFENLLNDFIKDKFDAYIPTPTYCTYDKKLALNDQMAILNYKGMIQYSKLLNYIIKFYDPNLGFFTEKYLKPHLEKGNIKIKNLNNIGTNTLVRSSEISTNSDGLFIYMDE